MLGIVDIVPDALKLPFVLAIRKFFLHPIYVVVIFSLSAFHVVTLVIIGLNDNISDNLMYFLSLEEILLLLMFVMYQMCFYKDAFCALILLISLVFPIFVLNVSYGSVVKSLFFCMFPKFQLSQKVAP